MSADSEDEMEVDGEFWKLSNEQKIKSQSELVRIWCHLMFHLIAELLKDDKDKDAKRAATQAQFW